MNLYEIKNELFNRLHATNLLDEPGAALYSGDETLTRDTYLQQQMSGHLSIMQRDLQRSLEEKQILTDSEQTQDANTSRSSDKSLMTWVLTQLKNTRTALSLHL